MTARDGWDGLLDEGETILWQGRPDGRVVWRNIVGFQGVFGLIITGFAIVWMSIASSIIGSGPGFVFPFNLFPVFGLPFLLIGIYLLVGHVIMDAYMRSTTWYTLTDRTAFIASNAFGRRKLAAYLIRDMPFLELEDTLIGSIWFGEHPTPAGQGAHVPRRIGFVAIPQARQVFAKIREARGALNFQDRQDRGEA